ncbi:4385_t:CDS:2 [Rhizophagus irregularis]|nr:4385_t:CDS:2 [Rhizophagus irregularis]
MENSMSSPPENTHNHSDNPDIKNPDTTNNPDNPNTSNNPDNNPDNSNNLNNSNNPNYPNYPNNTKNPNRKITLGSIKTIIQNFFIEEDISNMDPQDIQTVLSGLLDEYKNSTKPQEMIQVNVKHLPGEAFPITHTIYTINAWNERYDQLEEQLKNKRKDYIELYKKNEELRNEASQYQSALGDARNYRLGDNDANNPTQLTIEIGIIQDKINEFCKIKGGVDINEQNLARLLSEQFNCKYSEGDKVLPKAALQRIIVETIITRTNEYLTKGFQPEINDNRILNKYLELDIMNSTKNYLSKINTLINSRTGTDEVSFAAPKKIQQLVYAVLGDRGFGLSSDKREHEFVQGLNDEIIKYMSQFRTIKKADKRKENEDMLAEIIRNVIKMFVFRIKVLEPPAELIWIEKDTKVDATLMEVGNLEDDNYDDWVVNLCSFPLICVEPNSETNRKVLVPAKILAVKAEQKSLGSKIIKNLSLFHNNNKSQQPGADEAGKPTKKNSMDISN